MVQYRLRTRIITHILLLIGIAIVGLPIYIALVASSHTTQELMQAPIPLLPGHHWLENYKAVLTGGVPAIAGHAVAPMLLNSLIMALLIAFGKISVSIISAYAIVYFRFPFRKICFWLIFITLMLLVEVRILLTFEVVAKMHLLNSFSGLALPLIASATATFLFRQFFMTIPPQLVEAARLDGVYEICGTPA